MLRALIFDFNGVIVESTDSNAQIYYSIFLRFGKNVAEKAVEHYKKYGGIPRQKRIEMYLREFAGISPTHKLIEELSLEFSRMYMQSIKKAEFVPGSKEFLMNEGKIYDKFLSSGAPQDELPEILKAVNILQYFKEVFGAPAPKSEHILTILNKYNYAPNEVVFIGDSPKDREAALHNGIYFIARDRGLKELADEPFKIKDLTELPNVLKLIS